MKIYGLFDKRESKIIVYIGSTNRQLSRRLNDHFYIPTSPKVSKWIVNVGRENVGIVELEECGVAQRAERECWHMAQYTNLLNTKIATAPC